MPDRFPLLLDRDGTVMVDRHYLSNPAEIELEQSAAEGLRRLVSLGGVPVILTNQSGIARGMFDEAALTAVHARLDEILRAEGIEIAGFYHCPHGPEDGCDCRKPAPGMAQRAAADLDLDLSASVVIGDKLSDVDLALAIGALPVLVTTGKGKMLGPEARARSALVARNLLHASELLGARGYG